MAGGSTSVSRSWSYRTMNPRLLLVLLLVVSTTPTFTVARSWVTSVQILTVGDDQLETLLAAVADPLAFPEPETPTPSSVPSSGPTAPTGQPTSASPTTYPSRNPTTSPTGSPTTSFEPTSFPSISPSTSFIPTSFPTGVPTPSPTNNPTITVTQKPTITPSPTIIPTSSPSGQPTPLQWPNHPVPAVVSDEYFNYDTSPNATYGPGHPTMVPRNATHNMTVYENNYWSNVNVGYGSSNILLEFHEEYGFGPLKGGLEGRDADVNKCGEVGMQSPIDVRSTGAECFENHQMRHRPGDWAIDDDSNITKRILPNKLQLFYNRRPHRNAPEPDPPHTDLAYFWTYTADVTHIDFKVPAEHTIYGKRYEGEMQVFHLHDGKRRFAGVTMMIEANATTKHNKHMQKMLDQFWEEHNKTSFYCNNTEARQRRVSELEEELGGRSSVSQEIDEEGGHRRRLPKQKGESSGTPGSWNPFHTSFMKTIYFWGYDGSTTDPPCLEYVSWRIMDTPMQISYDQLLQMKELIFTNVDKECNPTSVQYNGHVVRPLQDVMDRDVYRCTRRHYISDKEFREKRDAEEAARQPSSAPSFTSMPTRSRRPTVGPSTVGPSSAGPTTVGVTEGV